MADLALRIAITARNKATRSLRSVRRELESIATTTTGNARTATRAAETEERTVRRVARARRDQGREVDRVRRGVRAITLEETRRNEKIREQNRLIKAQVRAEMGIKRGAGVDPDAAATNLSFAGAGLQRAGDAGTRFFLGARDDALDFSKAVAEVTTISDTSREEIEGLAKQAATEFGGLPADQARAFYSIVSAGFEKTGKAQELFTASNKLAVAGVTDTQSAFLALNSIMKPYADSVKDADTANELLFQTITDGQTTLPELANALPRVTALSSAAGVSIEEVLASISALTSGGLAENTNAAATQIAGAMAKIVKPTQQAKKEFEKLRQGSSALSQFASTAEAVENLGFKGFLDAVEASGSFDGESFGKLFDDVEGFRAVLSLQGAGEESFSKNLENLRDDTAVFGDALEKQLDDPSKKAEKQMAKLKVQMIELGEKAIPVIEKAADALLPVLNKVVSFADRHPELVKLALGAAVGSAVLGRGLQGASSLAGLMGGYGFQGFAGKRGGAPKVAGAPGMPAAAGPAMPAADLANKTMLLVATFTAAYQTMKFLDENYLGLSDKLAGVGKEDLLDILLHGGRTDTRGDVDFLKPGEQGYETQGSAGATRKNIAALERQIAEEEKKLRWSKGLAGVGAVTTFGIGAGVFGSKAVAEKQRIKELNTQLENEKTALEKIEGKIEVKVTDDRVHVARADMTGGLDLEVDGDSP